MKKHAFIWIAGFIIAAFGIIAFVSYSSLGSSGTARVRMREWVGGVGLGQAIGTLKGDGTHIDEVLFHHTGSGAIHTDCSLLSTDAGTANNNLPSPNSRVTALLAEAYQLDYEAGDACYAAGTTNPKLLAKSASERARAQVLLKQALTRIHRLTGTTVATTTTTGPTTGSIF